MRLHPGLMLAAMAMAASGPGVSMASTSTQSRDALPAQPQVKVVPTKRQQQRWAGVSPDYRAKGPQAKRRKRLNRLHVSKRTRRAHRRAKQGKR